MNLLNFLLLACVLSPLLGFLLIFFSLNHEHRIAAISLWMSRLMGVFVVALLATWAYNGFQTQEYQWFMLFEQQGYQFPVLFYLDKVSAAYLFCVWAIFSVIVKYCRVYMHRESGYKRFFQTIFAFVFGLSVLILSGSIDMLFAGWEVVGISSFLLIAFYRHRPQPIRNALRAYTIYRFCDVGLLMGAWMSHLLFHDSSHFSELATLFDNPIPPAGYASLSLLSWLIILAASGKSAQFPFCFWLPRAMEGPTPSSAIFYGALSIHLGVFLLLRTMPIWSYNFLPRLMILSIGVLTVLVATLSEKTQSNIKGQIAYSSITQVGLMFIELSLGLETLVLVHFMGNAFLRCYQLLVSPSIVAHLLRVEGAVSNDFYIANNHPKFEFLPESIRGSLPEVLQNTLYVFALQEGQLELLVRRILWTPLKRFGWQINTLKAPIRWLLSIMIFAMIAAGILLDINDMIKFYLSIPVALAMAVVSIAAFNNKHSPIGVWNSVAMSSVLAACAVLLMMPSAQNDVLLFLSGIIPSWLLGVVALMFMLKDSHFAESPFEYRAQAEIHPTLSLLLFLSFLGLIGFPITPAFLGEDLLLPQASTPHPWFALPITISFVINGIAAARVFLRLCMGRPVELRV
jgi:NADH-quinone oxidoreductase subunit L